MKREYQIRLAVHARLISQQQTFFNFIRIVASQFLNQR